MSSAAQRNLLAAARSPVSSKHKRQTMMMVPSGGVISRGLGSGPPVSLWIRACRLITKAQCVSSVPFVYMYHCLFFKLLIEYLQQNPMRGKMTIAENLEYLDTNVYIEVDKKDLLVDRR